MNILSRMLHKSRTVRCDTPRCTPQLETLDDRTLPSSFAFGAADQAVLPAAMPAFSTIAQRSILLSGAERNLTAQSRPPQPGEQITVRGTLHTGLFAIGGETTGYAIETADGHTYELQLNRAQQQRANRLDGQQVEVTGKLTIVQGVERPDREVIIVSRMRVVR